ncbi:MAG: hypothetical protein JRJ85_21765 [Deltaproteobacteria bacterium]|nr:hypothetical protein [Deltaproteobacteria bacterium]
MTAAGSPRKMQHLKEYVLSGKGILPNRLLGTICEGLFPQYLDVHELFRAARQARRQPPLSSRLLPYQFERIVQKCPADWLIEILKGFLDLADGKSPSKSEEAERSLKRFSWLIEPMCALIVRIVDELPNEEIVSDTVLTAIEFILTKRNQEFGHHSEFDKLRTKLEKTPQIRRALFWRHVDVQRSKGKETEMYLWELRLWDLSGWIGIVAEDITWLLTDISGKTIPEDRLLALDAAMNCWHMAGKPQDGLDRIVKAVEGEPALKERLKTTLNPPRRRERDFEKERKKREEARKRNEEKRLRNLREQMEKEIESIRTGENLGALVCLWDFMSNQSSRNRLGQTNWSAIISAFGKAIAEAAREGFMRFWRTWEPPLPHQKAEQHTIENGVLVGLTGIALAVENDLDFQSLSKKDAGIAARYATREFNFPTWLSRLAEAHPNTVRKVFRFAIRGESHDSSQKHHNSADVLGSLAHAPDMVRELCAPDLLDIIQKQDPDEIQILNLSLKALLGSRNIDRTRLAELAATRTQGSENDLPRFLAWLVGWLHLDGEGAVGFLESYLKSLDAKGSHDFLLNLSGEIYPHSNRKYHGIEADYLRIPVLIRLIPLLYSIIRPEDDVFREGTITSGTRDNAQDFRRHLMDRLGAIPGREAFDALMTLAEDPRIGRHRDWFLMLAQERAEQDAEFAPWEPEDVVWFANKFAAPIKSTGTEGGYRNR